VRKSAAVPDPQPPLVALGDALRQVRLDRRLSQEQLSLETGVHRNYIGGVERGERSPSVATLLRLATALRIELSELFRRAGL
jgi:transcriptional regulator with XRE-family HTH domain